MDRALEVVVVSTEDRLPAELTSPAMTWAGIILAWTAQLRQRTGSERTPTEYRRYAEHFRDLLTGQGKDLDHAPG